MALIVSCIKTGQVDQAEDIFLSPFLISVSEGHDLISF
jgi:hypothetical protein